MRTPLMSRKDVFGNWLGGKVDVWFRKLNQYQISEILDKAVEMLRRSSKPKDQVAWDLIFKKLHKKSKDIDRSLSKGDFYELVTKNWVFGLLELRSTKSIGAD